MVDDPFDDSTHSIFATKASFAATLAFASASFIRGVAKFDRTAAQAMGKRARFESAGCR